MSTDSKTRSPAICPHYGGESGTATVCKGIAGAETVRQNFLSGNKLRLFQAKYCCRDWQNCPLAKLH